MTRLDHDLESLSQRGTPADPDEVIARAFASAASSKQAVSARSSSALVGLAAACVIAVGLGAFAYVAANRQDVDNAPVSATTPSGVPIDDRATAVDTSPDPASSTSPPSSLVPDGLESESPPSADIEAGVPDGFVPPVEGPDDLRDPIQRFLGVPADVEEAGEWGDRIRGRAVVECMAARGFDLDESTWQTRVFDPSSAGDQELFDALQGDGGCEELANRKTNLLPDAETEFAVLERTMRADPRAIEAQAALQDCLERNGARDAVVTPDECSAEAEQSNDVFRPLYEEYGPPWIFEHRDILEPLRDRLAGLLERSATPN